MSMYIGIGTDGLNTTLVIRREEEEAFRSFRSLRYILIVFIQPGDEIGLQLLNYR